MRRSEPVLVSTVAALLCISEMESPALGGCLSLAPSILFTCEHYAGGTAEEPAAPLAWSIQPAMPNRALNLPQVSLR